MKKGTKMFCVGDILYNKEGFSFKIVNYKDAHNVTIIWQDCGTVQISNSSDIAKGSMKYLNRKSVFGVGYLGYGRFVPGERRMAEGQERLSPTIHRHWRHVLERTVGGRDIRRYEDCQVVEEWHNFQNFSEWAMGTQNSQAKEENGRLYHLDKDMVSENNRIYGPEYCVFVPNEVNCFYTKKDSGNTGFAGVNAIRPKTSGSKIGYVARCNKGKVREYLGYFDTPEEAFSVYKTHKEDYARELALKWEGRIDQRVIEYLENFKIRV